PRPVHAQRAPRYGPTVGGRSHARCRPPLRRHLAPNRRQHRHDHAHRVVAQPRRGRLPLDDAGLVFEEHDRSLVALVQNYELDILFVRTNDVIEFVGDGVADLGITGLDLLSETGAELPQVRTLGYGRCKLAAAVPTDSDAHGVEDLAGLRVATAHPETTRRFFAD